MAVLACFLANANALAASLAVLAASFSAVATSFCAFTVAAFNAFLACAAAATESCCARLAASLAAVAANWHLVVKASFSCCKFFMLEACASFNAFVC